MLANTAVTMDIGGETDLDRGGGPLRFGAVNLRQEATLKHAAIAITLLIAMSAFQPQVPKRNSRAPCQAPAGDSILATISLAESKPWSGFLDSRCEVTDLIGLRRIETFIARSGGHVAVWV